MSERYTRSACREGGRIAATTQPSPGMGSVTHEGFGAVLPMCGQVFDSVVAPAGAAAANANVTARRAMRDSFMYVSTARDGRTCGDQLLGIVGEQRPLPWLRRGQRDLESSGRRRGVEGDGALGEAAERD